MYIYIYSFGSCVKCVMVLRLRVAMLWDFVWYLVGVFSIEFLYQSIHWWTFLPFMSLSQKIKPFPKSLSEFSKTVWMSRFKDTKLVLYFVMHLMMWCDIVHKIQRTLNKLHIVNSRWNINVYNTCYNFADFIYWVTVEFLVSVVFILIS